MRPVGYLLNRGTNLDGEPGLFYDYILAGNGLFVRARSSLLAATVSIAWAQVRGLALLAEKMVLPKGKIPRHLYDLALSVLFADSCHERYLAITWEGEYRLRMPPQEGSSGGVQYEVMPNTVVDIHSHAGMSAFFSSTDNRDERGLRLYMVVGRLDTLVPEREMRVGVYGYFSPVEFDDVFA
ncbi:MAG: Mov34/MPN/PAD-1 family protein [Chloroflexi bacterium]|nr:Mov34/MPN/PAD-1 family protein [Chloroflexota bacterium]